jgi:hypothetical protein
MGFYGILIFEYFLPKLEMYYGKGLYMGNVWVFCGRLLFGLLLEKKSSERKNGE